MEESSNVTIEKFDNTELKEILGSEYENLLYDPYDIDALAKLILNQINKPIKVKQTILEKGFSVEQVLKKYEKLINSPF